jgi:hypothetical protein
MDISIYFQPISLQGFQYARSARRKLMGDLVNAYIQEEAFPSLSKVDLAIFGVGEDRNSFFNKGCASAPDAVRKEFYKLNQGSFKPRIVDLGNISN